MHNPTDGYPRAAAISPRVQVADHTGSTNTDLVLASADVDAWPHLSVLLTTDQRHGRGRVDRRWETKAGAALAVSVLLRLPALPVTARGWIPLAAGVAMRDAIGAQLAVGETTLKWPNDVLVSGKKICGILAEATPALEAVVVGAGVNTRMAAADLPVDTATSFAALSVTNDDDRLVADWISKLDALLSKLVDADGDAQRSGLHTAVTAACSTLGRTVRVMLPGGEDLVGEAVRLDEDGRLVVSAAGVERAVAAGDVVHVR